jgi:hypothetical protein
MTLHRRTVVGLVALALAGAGLLGLTACERPGSPTAAPAAAVDAPAAALAAAAGLEEQALTALGFAPSELTAAKPGPGSSAEPGGDPSAGPGRGERGKNRRPLARALLRGRVLHAEAVVQTDEGVKTLISQRGTITAIDDDSVTVKSADGFTLTWTFGDELRVIDRRRTVQPTDLAEGVEVGVAGAKDGDASVARLIIRPFKQK